METKTRKTRTVRCKICGTLFTATNPKARYCSDACRCEGLRRVRKAWMQTHPDRCCKYYKTQREKASKVLKERIAVIEKILYRIDDNQCGDGIDELQLAIEEKDYAVLEGLFAARVKVAIEFSNCDKGKVEVKFPIRATRVDYHDHADCDLWIGKGGGRIWLESMLEVLKTIYERQADVEVIGNG